MRTTLVPILLLSLLILFCGCSKDEDIAQLEQETMEAESADYISEETENQEFASSEIDTASTTEYAMTPEATPEEERAPEITPSVSGQGGYTIQIASGNNFDNVNSLQQKYLERGYDAFISQAFIDGETVYRLRIGNFENFSEAKALGLELKDRYSVNFWIAINE